jgi:hypothetical protein
MQVRFLILNFFVIVFFLSGFSFCGIWVSSFNMAHFKTLKPPKNFKLCCLFGQESKVVGNVVESNNQGATRALRDKKKINYE